MGFYFIVIVPLLLSHCGFSFVFVCGVSFLVSSSVFLLMIVQQLVVIPVFSQEGVRARPSCHLYFLFVFFLTSIRLLYFKDINTLSYFGSYVPNLPCAFKFCLCCLFSFRNFKFIYSNDHCFLLML